MICAVCRGPVHKDGDLGYVHDDGETRFAEDGHEVVAIRREPLAGGQAFGLH